ncbi:MAG: hypothetical protein V4629_14075 [Pseudomonadota bacterium]
MHRDISNTHPYSKYIGKKVYLYEAVCLYRSGKGRSTFSEFRIKPLSIKNTNSCKKNYSPEEKDEPIEVLSLGTEIMVIKAMQEREPGGYNWDFIIGSVHSKSLKQEIEFEYLLHLPNESGLMPWLLTQPFNK